MSDLIKCEVCDAKFLFEDLVVRCDSYYCLDCYDSTDFNYTKVLMAEYRLDCGV